MIKFFRRIRQKLLTESKFSKYLLYAIGEIILVVIGILIALQINNWNEERKLKNEERELLTNLNLSYTRKLNELENKNFTRAENIKGINKLLNDISNQKRSIPDDEMFKILGNLFIWNTVNEEFSVLEMLFNSGRINTISNDSLKAKLISWPDNMEEMYEEQRVIQDLVVNKLNPLISNYVSTSNLANSFVIKSSLEISPPPSPYPNDFTGLLNDRAFESLISEKKLYLYTNLNDTSVLIEEAQSILELIKAELDND